MHDLGIEQVGKMSLLQRDPRLRGISERNWIVVCDKCACQGQYARTKEEAIELWNRRASE